MSREDAIFCNAGYERIPPNLSNPKMDLWNDLQFEMMSPWDTVRHDAPTLGLALEYIRAHKPRAVYLALGETDDWAHDRRYDRVAQSIDYFDEALRRLWTLLQSTEPYRGKSTLIVTTDHGRGRTLEDWTSHGKDVPGADETWLAIFGPDVPPKGEMKNSPPYSLSNVAATICALLGISPEKYSTTMAPPLRELAGSSAP
jgi:phosphopentomutase